MLSVTQLRHCQGRPSLTAFGAPISLIRTSIHDPWRKIYHKSRIVPWTEVTLRRHQPSRSDEVDTLDTLRPNSETPANPTCIRKWGRSPFLAPALMPQRPSLPPPASLPSSSSPCGVQSADQRCCRGAHDPRRPISHVTDTAATATRSAGAAFSCQPPRAPASEAARGCWLRVAALASCLVACTPVIQYRPVRFDVAGPSERQSEACDCSPPASC